MSDISQYEARLVQALGRISAGLALWPDTPAPAVAPEPVVETAPEPDDADAGELARLRIELEDERTANAQLEQRVKQIRRKQEGRVEQLETELASSKAALGEAERQTARLRRSSEDLRQALETLQKATADGLSEPHLINRAMMAELEALRAERAQDANEIGDLLSLMEPLVKEADTNA